MKAVVFDNYGGIDQLHLADLPTPQPLENEVQIALEYAGVNPVDGKILNGLLKERLPSQFPIILGWDGAGVVSAVGSLKIGDRVYAYFRNLRFNGAHFANSLAIQPNTLCLSPKSYLSRKRLLSLLHH